MNLLQDVDDQVDGEEFGKFVGSIEWAVVDQVPRKEKVRKKREEGKKKVGKRKEKEGRGGRGGGREGGKE